MKVRTRHLLSELAVRSKLALKDDSLIEIVEAHKTPSGAQKAANMLGYKQYAYSVWALAALKRDYPVDYSNLQAIKVIKN